MNRLARLLGAKPQVVASFIEDGERDLPFDEVIARLEDTGDPELRIDYDVVDEARRSGAE